MADVAKDETKISVTEKLKTFEYKMKVFVEERLNKDIKFFCIILLVIFAQFILLWIGQKSIRRDVDSRFYEISEDIKNLSIKVDALSSNKRSQSDGRITHSDE